MRALGNSPPSPGVSTKVLEFFPTERSDMACVKKKSFFLFFFFNLHVVDKSGAMNACVNAKRGRKTSQVLICRSLAAGVDLYPKCA